MAHLRSPAGVQVKVTDAKAGRLLRVGFVLADQPGEAPKPKRRPGRPRRAQPKTEDE